MTELSERQKAIMKYLADYSETHGYPPTIREIGMATGINSTSVVNYNLNKLVKFEMIERTKKISRGIRIVA